MLAPLSLADGLLAVQLDDELLAHRDLDVLAGREAPHEALELVRVKLEPLRHLAPAGVHVLVNPRQDLRGREGPHHIANPNQVGGHRDLSPVHLEVSVGDHLPPFAAGGREAEPVDDVVESPLEVLEEILARDPLLPLRRGEVAPELGLEHPVDPLRLLLLPELDPEGGQLAAVQAVLARRVVPALDRALVGEAPRPLQEQLHAFSPAEPALRVAIARHRRVSLHPASLGLPATVVGDRRHVVDRADLQSHRLERPDGRLAPRARSLHEHLDLLEAVLHGLARGDFCRRLGGERRALARALETDAARAGPGHDVARLVGEGDDGVVERRLHVRHARADLASFPLLAALLPGGGLGCGRLRFCHGLRSCLPGRRRRGRRRLLLDHHAPAGPLARSRVRMGALPADRQSLPVPDAPIAPDVHEALDVHRDLAAKVAFHLELALDDLADARGLVLVPGPHPLVGVDGGALQHAPGRRLADAVDVREGHLTALVAGQIDSGHACHIRSLSALALVVPGVLADDPDDSGSSHDLAVLTAHLDGRPNLHHRSSRPYLNRYVIRPRVRSYGDSSTLTRSPGRMRMKFMRILPLTWASTRWPFSSSTRNIAFGRGSTTVPSTSIASSLVTPPSFDRPARSCE